MALPFVAPGLPRPDELLAVPFEAVRHVRRGLALQVTNLLAGDHAPITEQRTSTFADDPGYFGPDSVTWRIHDDACVLVGGVRALMLQTMHPLAMAGVAQHSNYRDDPLERLANTTMYVGTTIYGSKDDVARAIALVKRVHVRVQGTAPDGRHYDANDPHLLTFVHHTLVDSFLRAYQRYGSSPLSAADADRYVAEQAVLADLFEAEPAARSVTELEAYFDAMRTEMRATAEARDTIRFLLAPPLPLIARAPYAVLVAASITMLPRWIRWQLRLPVLPTVEPLIVRPAGLALVRTLDWVLAAHPAAPPSV